MRAVLLDEHGRLVLLKRTLDGQAPYWTTPGGGVEAGDASVEAALVRELTEELGATAIIGPEVLSITTPFEDGSAVQHFFVARLVALDAAARCGPELRDPARGRYELEHVALDGDAIEAVALLPDALKAYLLAHRAAVLAEAARLVPRAECSTLPLRHHRGDGSPCAP